ncbi:MAG: hypothetical protein JEY94_12890 [Melioribacteraceae bacterium]|nr:hypothetical protein [Melioribacteraceae bacterium]
MTKYKSNSRQWLGIVLIILGAFLILDNFYYFYLTDLIFSWQMIFIAVGTFILINKKHDYFGLILIGIGGISIASEYFNFSAREVFSDFWPILLILLGVYVLYKRDNPEGRKDKKCCFNEEDGIREAKVVDGLIDITAIFHSIKQKYDLTNFRGGKITALFGHAEIDLSNCHLAEGTNIIDVFTMFGGTEIYVPKGYKTLVEATAIFGGVDDKRRSDPNEILPDDKILIIKGLTLFGGCEIFA